MKYGQKIWKKYMEMHRQEETAHCVHTMCPHCVHTGIVWQFRELLSTSLPSNTHTHTHSTPNPQKHSFQILQRVSDFTTYLHLKPLPKFSNIKRTEAFLLPHSHSPNSPADLYSLPVFSKMIKWKKHLFGIYNQEEKELEVKLLVSLSRFAQETKGLLASHRALWDSGSSPWRLRRAKREAFSPLQAPWLVPHSLTDLVTCFTNV